MYYEHYGFYGDALLGFVRDVNKSPFSDSLVSSYAALALVNVCDGDAVKC